MSATNVGAAGGAGSRAGVDRAAQAAIAPDEIPPAGPPAILAESPAGDVRQLVDAAHLQRIADYAAAATADETRRAYQHDWRQWERWCQAHGYAALPAAPLAIAAHVAGLADGGRAVSGISRRLAAIGRIHREHGIDPPPTRSLEVQKVMRGVRRRLGVAPTRQRAPISPAELRQLLAAIDPDSLAGLRDRALLLVGFYLASRRSELARLEVEDVLEVGQGLRVTIRRSKTDQEAAGDIRGIPRQDDPELCPVEALRHWRAAGAITAGPLWRQVDRWGVVGRRRLSGQSVALVVKRACQRASIDPARYAGHSLRSGFATAAGMARAPERAIMRQTGHRSVAVLRGYIRPASIWHENAGYWVRLNGAPSAGGVGGDHQLHRVEDDQVHGQPGEHQVER